MLDGLFIDALSRELNASLRTGRVAAIWASDPTTIICEIRRGAQRRFLLLSAHPRAARLYLVPEEELPANRLAATPFIQLLRKHLEGARVQQVVQPGEGRERLVRMELDTRGEGGAGYPLYLVVELIGTKANLVLVDGTTGLVVDALRSQRGGHPYEPPARQDKVVLAPGMREEFLRRLRWLAAGVRGPGLPVERAIVELVDGVGPLTGTEFAGRAGLVGATVADLADIQRERLAAVLEEAAAQCEAGNFHPTLLVDAHHGVPADFAAVELSSFPSDRQRKLASPSQALHLFYEPRLAGWRLDEQRQRLTHTVKSELARALRRRDRQREELAHAAGADEWRKRGELLLSQLHLVPRGATEVELVDYYTDPPQPVRISLDPALSPQENAARHFNRYGRAKRAQVAAREQLARSEEEVEYLEGVLASLGWAESEADLAEIEAELEQAGLLETPKLPRSDRGQGDGRSRRSPTKGAMPAPRFRRFVTADGLEVFVGRNNRQNEELTFHVARPRDLWFHAQKMPGAHVILRRAGATDGDVPPASIVAAARLAAYFSRGAANARVPVDYTERRFVRKPTGTPPGFVTYTSFKTVDVAPTIEDLKEAGQARE